MRIRSLFSIYTLLFVFLVAGLFRLQVVHGSYFSRLGERNRIRVVPGPAARGPIYDRAGKPLAHTRPAFNVLAVPDEISPSAVTRLASILVMDSEEIEETLRGTARAPFLSVLLARDVLNVQVFQIEEQGPDLPGVFIEVEPLRHYPNGEIGAHVVGYVSLGRRAMPLARAGEEKQTVSHRTYGWTLPEPVGVTGIEQALDDILRGEAGGQQVEVDNRGRRQRLLGFKSPKQGSRVDLTLDLELTRLTHTLLGDRPGVVVVLDPRSGEVLALTNSPSYDPGVFVESARAGERAHLLRDPRRPLFNRALMGQYPPGSTFKMVTAATALEDRFASPESRFTCSGVFQLGPTFFKCWLKEGHGSLDLTHALASSCNSYFYQLGLKLGPKRLARGARRFGLGEKTGIRLAGEEEGLVPGPRWKRTTKGEAWYGGETAHFSIGQGYVSVTPIQAAQLVSAFANGGYLVRPYLVKGTGSRPRATGVSPRHIAAVREGLVQAVNEPWGTGRRAYVPGFSVAGKTGTAEVAGAEPHSWFCGFAPAQDAEIAVVVFVEHGGAGSGAAARIAGRIFAWWKEQRT